MVVNAKDLDSIIAKPGTSRLCLRSAKYPGESTIVNSPIKVKVDKHLLYILSTNEGDASIESQNLYASERKYQKQYLSDVYLDVFKEDVNEKGNHVLRINHESKYLK